MIWWQIVCMGCCGSDSWELPLIQGEQGLNAQHRRARCVGMKCKFQSAAPSTGGNAHKNSEPPVANIQSSRGLRCHKQRLKVPLAPRLLSNHCCCLFSIKVILVHKIVFLFAVQLIVQSYLSSLEKYLSKSFMQQVFFYYYFEKQKEIFYPQLHSPNAP